MMNKMLVGLITLVLLQGCSDKSDIKEKVFDDGIVQSATEYKIHIPAEMNKLAPSFPLAIGSSLQFKERTADGRLMFWGLTDRGPNVGIDASLGGQKISGYTMLSPGFAPFISLIEVKPGVSASVVNYKTIMKDGLKISGTTQGCARHNPMTVNLEPVPSVPGYCLDAESIAVDKDGNFWIGDENGPSINLVDGNGNVLKSYTPGDGLPEILAQSQLTRGFESIAVGSNGLVYALFESALDIDGKTKKTAQFVRMVELNPNTGQVRMFAYPLTAGSPKTLAKIKINDLAVINDNLFLAVERSENESGQLETNIYKIDVSGADDISQFKLADGKELEFGQLSELQGIRPIKKELLLTAQKYGWSYDKLEGLTVIDDRTIAVTNDNDFGVAGIKLNERCYKQGCPVVEVVRASEHDKHTYLWMIRLAKPLVN